MSFAPSMGALSAFASHIKKHTMTLGMRLSWQSLPSVNRAFGSPLLPQCIKRSATVLLTPAIPVLRTRRGRAILQGHPQSCSKSEGSLDYKIHCLKQNKKPAEPLSSCLVFGNCFCRLGEGHNPRRCLGLPSCHFQM